MKQVININFQGQVVPIEVSAFDMLKKYIDSLRRYFANEEGRDEIINDIESRIAELFQERLKAGTSCITEDDVTAIIASMGRPEDFEEVTGAASASEAPKTEQKASSEQQQQQQGHKRLYRDENNKVLGGVCAGLANYFGLDPVVVRIIFVVLFFFAGFGIIPYIIFWIAVPSTASTVIGGSRKKFFRDPDDKIIAGVCSGIGNYFGINSWIPRVLFLLPFISVIFRWGHWGFYDFPSFLNFSFSPGSVIVYIILWLVVPEAATTAEKLEMKGEKVDMNSIKNSVMEEMKGVGQRVEKFGQEAKTFAEDKGKVVGSEATRVVKRSRGSLGNIIATMAKVVAYIIIGFACLMLIILLFVIGIFSIGVFPIKDYVLASGWQNAFAWGTLLFFIAVPIIGIITWIIRRLAKIRGNSKMVRWAFGGLWVIGWVSAIFLVASLSNDFSRRNRDKVEEVALTNPSVAKLEISSGGRADGYFRRRGFRFEPFEDFEPGDTLWVNNIDINIAKSTNDSFRVTVVKMARGSSPTDADATVSRMDYPIRQLDSMLLLPKGIGITPNNKFRNQHIRLDIYVPVGKKIRINKNTDWNNNIQFGPFDHEDWRQSWEEYDFYEHGWRTNVDYIMGQKGLMTLDGKMVDEDKFPSKKKRIAIDDDNADNNDNYRYDDSGNLKPMSKADSLGERIRLQNKKLSDSIDKSIRKKENELQEIEREKEKLRLQKEKIDQTNNEPSALNMGVMPLYSPLMHSI